MASAERRGDRPEARARAPVHAPHDGVAPRRDRRRRYQLKERALTALLAELHDVNGASIYSCAAFRNYLQVLERHGRHPQGMRMLELGPGRNAGVGVLFAMHGVESYTGVEVHDDPDLENPVVFHTLQQMARLFPGSIVRSFDEIVQHDASTGEWRLDHDRVQFLHPVNAECLPFADASFDYVCSNAFFEHVCEPERVIREIRRVLKPGGIAAHQVDLRDHRFMDQDPLDHLRYSAEAWAALFPVNVHVDIVTANWTNRWRAHQYREAFEDAGFTIRECAADLSQGHFVTDELRAALHPDYHGRSLEELSTLGVHIVAQAPA